MHIESESLYKRPRECVTIETKIFESVCHSAETGILRMSLYRDKDLESHSAEMDLKSVYHSTDTGALKVNHSTKIWT